MGLENQRLWKTRVLENKKADGRQAPRTIHQLDETKLRGIVRCGDSAQIKIDGILSAFVFRNAVAYPGVLGFLKAVARWSSENRLHCRIG